MPIDLMFALVLLIEELESRIPGVADDEERLRLVKLLNRMDGLLEKCLAARFSERDRWARETINELKSAQRKVKKWKEDRENRLGLLGEISDLLYRLDACLGR